MKSKVNFHIHTVHSDGGKTVGQIVCELKEQGVTHFAITDHDTVDGVDEAMRLAEENGLYCVSGVEITGVFSNGVFGADVTGLDNTCFGHIVALDFDMSKMRKLLYDYKLMKEESVIKLTYDLLRDGYRIRKGNILLNIDTAGRTTVAKELVRAGYATDVNDAFERIINSPKYRKYSEYPYISNVLHDIKHCGGLAVIAHPFGYVRGGKKEMDKEQVAEYIKSFKYADAIETYYQQYDADRIAYLEELADKYGLMKTIGTDYHHSRMDLAKYPEYVKRLKKETLCFDVDGVTADESILSVINGRRVKKEISFDLHQSRFDRTSHCVSASLNGMILTFSDIFTESVDGCVDQSEATYTIKNLETQKFLNAIGCSIYDGDDKLEASIKKAFDEAGCNLERMLEVFGAVDYEYFVNRSED